MKTGARRRPKSAALWCDVGQQVGLGHAMRMLSLGAGLRDHGWDVVLVGPLPEAGLVARSAANADIHMDRLPDAVDVRRLPDVITRADVVVLDGYRFPDVLPRCLDRSGVAVAAMADMPDQWCDVPLVVNQNYGAERRAVARVGQRLLAGIDYALLRDEVLRRRPAQPRRIFAPVANVLVVFGGTDPTGAGPLLARLVLATGLPVHVQLVAPRPELAEAAHRLRVSDGQLLTVHDVVDDLPQLASSVDVVVTAAGSSLWEWACLAVPALAVCVADNQRPGYDHAVSDGLIVGVGSVSDVRADPDAVIQELSTLFERPAHLRLLSERGWKTVDGGGRRRVADALGVLVDGCDGGTT